MPQHEDQIAAGQAAAVLQTIDLGDWSVLLDPTADDLASIFTDAAKRAMPLVGFASGNETRNEARQAMGLDAVDGGGDEVPAIISFTNDRAVEWARNRAADLVTQIEENTRDMLRTTVTQAQIEGWGAQELARRIRDSAGFSQYRSELIARTETIRANSQGNLAVYKETGVATGKSVLTAGDDLVEEICQENADQGIIGIDEDFASGDETSPFHPQCRCSVVPEIEPLESEEA